VLNAARPSFKFTGLPYGYVRVEEKMVQYGYDSVTKTYSTTLTGEAQISQFYVTTYEFNEDGQFDEGPIPGYSYGTWNSTNAVLLTKANDTTPAKAFIQNEVLTGTLTVEGVVEWIKDAASLDRLPEDWRSETFTVNIRGPYGFDKSYALTQSKGSPAGTAIADREEIEGAVVPMDINGDMFDTDMSSYAATFTLPLGNYTVKEMTSSIAGAASKFDDWEVEYARTGLAGTDGTGYKEAATEAFPAHASYPSANYSELTAPDRYAVSVTRAARSQKVFIWNTYDWESPLKVVKSVTGAKPPVLSFPKEEWLRRRRR
jgi:hypothetical protein